MKKSTSQFSFWLYAIGAVLVLYFGPLVLLIADAGSGTMWFHRNAPQEVQDAVVFIYKPIDWLMNWLVLLWMK